MKLAFIGWSILAAFGICAQPLVFNPLGPGGGGYMYSPSISPHDNDELWLVCDMAGVYRSTDAGAAWQLQHYNQLVSLVKGKVQFSADPLILYTINRSLSNQESPLFRGVPMKSMDGGASWHAITDPTATGVHRLYADPGSTQRLLLNEYDRLFFSEDGGESFAEVFHPADDQMWLGGVFWDGPHIYVGTGKGLLVSHDGGQSFALEDFPGLPQDLGFFHLTGAKYDGLTRLFAITASAADMYAWEEVIDLQPALQGMYRLDYGFDAQWTDTRGNIPAEARLQWVDLASNNIQIVWAAGENNGLPLIYKSIDGGDTWVNTFHTDNNENVVTGWGGDYGPFSYQWGGSPLGFDVADNNPNIVLATDGFSHITTDGGLSWRALNVSTAYLNEAGQPSPVDKYYQSSGLNVTTGHHLLFLGQEELFAGSTDIGNQYTQDGGQSWSFARNVFYPWGTVSDPNWYMIQQGENSETLFAAVADVNDIYLGYRIKDESIEWADGMVLKSSNKGLSWDTIHYFGRPVVWLAVDQQNPQRMFASVVHHETGGIYRSLDGGFNWTKLSLPQRTEGHPYNIRLLNDGGLVVTFSARALDDGITLTPSSGVFYSPDGGATWQDRTPAEMMYYTKDLIIDPHDLSQNTWYATVWGRFTVFPGPNNEGNGGLYRTYDRGLHWERVFAHERAESATLHPVQSGVMYLTVEMEGLFYSENINSESPVFEQVESFPFPRPKRVFFNPFDTDEVWVTTMGGAFWKGRSSIVSVKEPNVLVDHEDVLISPNPATNFIRLDVNSSGLQHFVEVWLVDVFGKTTIHKKMPLSPKQQQVELELDGVSSGVYFLKIRSGAFCASKKLVIHKE